jgi:DNA replication protein DnaC
MRTVATPGKDGYGWRMSDSERLRAEVERRANARLPRRVPVLDVIAEMAQKEAARRGIDPREFLAKITDPERGDRLLAEAEVNLHRERLARQADILLARLPSKYRDATFPRTDFGREAKAWLDQYRATRRARRSMHNLVILGGTGTGKTWTACAIARALLAEDAVPVTVTTVADFLAALRPAVAGMDVDMLQFTTTPVLVLDDLGMERLTEWGAEQLYRLADERSRNDRPVIVTSNLTGEQIKAQYDRRTVERLFGGAQLIQISGDTRRPMPF